MFKMANFNLNKVILGGRMVRDPELRQTSSGIPVTSFSIAVNRKYTSQQDSATGGPTADFINVVAWRSQAEFVCKYFRKGSSICVVGSIQTRSWEDKNGQSSMAPTLSPMKSTLSTAKMKTLLPATRKPAMPPVILIR